MNTGRTTKAPREPAHARSRSRRRRSGSAVAALTGLGVVVAIVVVAALAITAMRDDGATPLPSAPAAAPATPLPARTATPAPTAESLVVTAPIATAGDTRVIDRASEVVLVGDSLAEGAAPPLAALVDAAGGTLRVDARTGRGTADGARALAAMAVAPDAVVVVVLGTNDGDDPDEAVRNIAAVLDAVPDGTVIRWVDVAAPGATVVNDTLAAVAAIDTDVEVLHWSTMVADNRDLLVADGIHFTGEGYVALAAFIAAEALELHLDGVVG